MTKAIVAFVYVVGALQTAFALHDFYTLFCVPGSFQQPDFENRIYGDDLHEFSFMWITIPLSGASVAAVSQLFYAHRIYVLSRKKLIPGVVIVLTLLQLGVGIYVAFTRYSDHRPANLVAIPSGFLDIVAWELCGTICDLVTAIYMFRFISSHMQQSFRPTRISLIRIKRLTLETGLLTTTAALAYAMVSFFTDEGFMIPGLSLSKIYGNSILALLNGRLKIPGGRDETDSACVNHLAITEQPGL